MPHSKHKPANKNPDRFWSKVDIAGPDECWLWTASCSNKSYGKLWWGPKCEGAHRISYMLEHGLDELPKTMDGSRADVMHSCDEPKCVNPAHLSLGTAMLNQRDKTAKGRHHMHQRKTCKYGHEWTEENTGFLAPPSMKAKDGKQWVARYCKTCHSNRGKKYYYTVDGKRRQNPEYKKRKNARRRELYAKRNPNATLRGERKRGKEC
jgi:hypothetical protein